MCFDNWYCSSQCFHTTRRWLFLSLAFFFFCQPKCDILVSSSQASKLFELHCCWMEEIGFKCQERWQKWLTCFCFPVCVICMESWQRWSCHGEKRLMKRRGEMWQAAVQASQPLCSINTSLLSLCNSTALAGVEPETFAYTRAPTPWNTPISHGHLIYFLITLHAGMFYPIFWYIFLNCMYFCLLGKTDLSLLLQ